MKFKFISSSTLKIIAMITMVIDHIGAYIFPSYELFRIIGRISFPLFIFLTYEGITFTKKPINYLIRLFFLSVFTDIATYICLGAYLGNPVTTLLIGGLTIYLLKQDKWYLKLLSIIPIIFAYFTGVRNFPFRMQYGLYGIVIILIFFVSEEITKLIYKIKNLDIDKLHHVYLTLWTSLSFIMFFIYTYFTIQYAYKLNTIFAQETIMYSLQSFSIVSFVFIFLYNRKKGIDNKYFKYGCYLFFPIHFILIYLLSLII